MSRCQGRLTWSRSSSSASRVVGSASRSSEESSVERGTRKVFPSGPSWSRFAWFVSRSKNS
ncbi:MAG: hypothetical protein EA350_09660 [Gemmatimonadales bacterium]|nr:MAG: hypothetical protein EA350_09660 [Gemmatimonadales bacterium]